MKLLFLIYWISLLISFFLALLVIWKRNYLTGFLQLILSIILPFWLFAYLLRRDWIVGTEEDVYYFLKQTGKFDLQAVCLMICYIVLLGLIIYHSIQLYKRRKE